MKLQFNSNQDYQLQAIQSVIDLFDGQPLADGGFEITFPVESGSLKLAETGLSNNLLITQEQILNNLHNIQKRNDIKLSESLMPSMSDDKSTTYTHLNFTIEMETGTGKTYTFLRTIYELNKVYGFKKFVIVVPSVAIREGILKSHQITHEHFQSLYDNQPINCRLYDRANISRLRNFSVSNNIEILIINIDSFTKDNNVINTMRETGVKPIQYIQRANPIVIIDEPQNFETDIRKAAIQSLNPMCTLRYSATHRNFYNLLYSLNPIKAYDLGLVKQIEVEGIEVKADKNTAYVKLLKIDPRKRKIKITLEINVKDLVGISTKRVIVEVGSDLYKISGGLDVYENGYIINSVNTEPPQVEFSGGLLLELNQDTSQHNDEILKYQIERTLEYHFKKEIKLWQRANKVKVITLFFIDKVANYRLYQDGKVIQGKFAKWFEKIFERLAEEYRPKYEDLFSARPHSTYTEAKKVHESDIPEVHQILDKHFKASTAHNGYFASDKKGILKDTKGNTKDDEDIYSLIMKDKERLLSFDEPLRFIFSHSALREGWDSPNVFQICTLNETKSDIKKRQEIGRGLRLAVDEMGDRVHDKNINVLTVIANESYESFSKSLQKEIEDETFIKFDNRIKDARKKKEVKRSKELTIENYPLLFEIWEKISFKTKYSVEYDSKDLIRNVVKKLVGSLFVSQSVLDIRSGKLQTSEYKGLQWKTVSNSVKALSVIEYPIPNMYDYIQSKVNITRKTIYEILKGVLELGKKDLSDRNINNFRKNPQAYLDKIIAAIKGELIKLMVDGIKYSIIDGERYEMTLFDFEEIEMYISNLFEVTRTDKTIFNYIPVDSDTERSFAKECEEAEYIKFYFKLPKGFEIPTPLGNYIPDWAVVFENDFKVYFIAETKGVINEQYLRESERLKTECAYAVFKDNKVKYGVVRNLEDMRKLAEQEF